MQKALIKPNKPRSVSISILGSKSFTNRALIVAALADGETILKNPLLSEDTLLTKEALEKLGIKITLRKKDLVVEGKGGKFTNPKSTLYLGNAGTGIRFITALLALAPFKSKITGNKRMLQRPICDLLEALEQLGADAKSSKENGCPPVKIGPAIIEGGEVKISGSLSSQFVSALLMISPYAKKDIVIKITDKIISSPYVDMTIQIMNDFGVKVENKNSKEFFIKAGQKYTPREYSIEGDTSSATYFFALSALHKVPLKIKNIPPKTKQADIHFLHALKKMGCEVKITEKEISVNRKKPLMPLGSFDCNHMPDASMTIAVLSAFAKGKTTLNNIGSLRIKETDRLKALCKELKKLGVEVAELPEGIEINGGSLKTKGATAIETYNDHRMAMCFSILATRVPDLHILNPQCVAKTYPNFFEDLRKTQIDLKIQKLPNIVLTGMRGSGKTAIGKQIAKKLNASFIDTDKEIERNERMSIPQIIKRKNWFYFRKKEKYVIRRISKMKNVVIATGGGVIIDKENEKALKKHGKTIFLLHPLEVLEKRLKNSKTERPGLTKNEDLKKEIEEIWEKRKERYLNSADLVFEATDDMSIEEKAEKIIVSI